MVLDTALLNTQHCKVRIKGKWSNPGNGVALCSSYLKGNFRVTLDYGRQLYFLLSIIINHDMITQNSDGFYSLPMKNNLN